MDNIGVYPLYLFSVRYESIYNVGEREVEQIGGAIGYAHVDRVLKNHLNAVLAGDRCRLIRHLVIKSSWHIEELVRADDAYVHALVQDGWLVERAMSYLITEEMVFRWRHSFRRSGIAQSWHVGQGRLKLFVAAESKDAVTASWD